MSYVFQILNRGIFFLFLRIFSASYAAEIGMHICLRCRAKVVKICYLKIAIDVDILSHSLAYLLHNRPLMLRMPE